MRHERGEKRNCRYCSQPMYFGGMCWWHTHNESQFCNIPSLPTMQQGEPENDAEDRVRCAAPELLAALKALFALVQGECPSVLRDDHHFDLVTAAIAKAEGSDGE